MLDLGPGRHRNRAERDLRARSTLNFSSLDFETGARARHRRNADRCAVAMDFRGKKTPGVGGWPPNSLAREYLDLIAQHTAALSRKSGFPFWRGFWLKNFGRLSSGNHWTERS